MERGLKLILIVSTVLMSPVVWMLSMHGLPAKFDMAQSVTDVTSKSCAIAILLGLLSGLVIGLVTKYYTSSTYVPVREIAETQKQSAATGIMYGLALSYLSRIVPVCCLAVSVLVAPSSAACSVWPSAPSACLGP